MFQKAGSNHKPHKGCSSPPTIKQELDHSDSHLFGALEGAVRGKRFGSDDEVTEEVNKWLRVQNSNWYKQAIDAVTSRWREAVEVDGYCVEKRCVIHPSSYRMIVFKELRNKLIAVKNCVAKCFGATFLGVTMLSTVN